jgi:hypothetical protein
MPSPTNHARNERLLQFWAKHPEIPQSTIALRFGLTMSGLRKIVEGARAAGHPRVQQDRRGHTR